MKMKNVGYAAFVAATAAAFVLGSLSAGEAKAKQKPAAAPAWSASPSNICFNSSGPVCAAKGKDGLKFTYASSCTATAEGAKIVANKACPPAKPMKVAKVKSKKIAKK
jgi:hypothetical protein